MSNKSPDAVHVQASPQRCSGFGHIWKGIGEFFCSTVQPNDTLEAGEAYFLAAIGQSGSTLIIMLATVHEEVRGVFHLLLFA